MKFVSEGLSEVIRINHASPTVNTLKLRSAFGSVATKVP